MTIFVDSSVWFATIVARDRNNARAKAVLLRESERVTTDHVVIETWLLLNSRYHQAGAELFWGRIRRGIARIENTGSADLERAWEIGQIFPDQSFSIADRTSFAAMERLGITRAASFNAHFAIYRYGRARDRAFEIVR